MKKAVDSKVQLIDEYGEVCRQCAECKPLHDRKTALEREIASWFDAAPADQSQEAEGGLYLVQISARKRVREITNMPKLFSFLSRATFLEWCSFPLTAIDRLIPDTSHKLFLVETQAGARSVKPILKAPAKAA